jgi:Transglycosylase-like domain
MDEGSYRPRAATEYRGRAEYRSRPDRIAFWALILALVAMIAGAASARAGSGGVGTGSGGTSTNETRYAKIWDGYSHRDKRWAHRTSDCESGGDPKAIGGDGRYRGAFQFTRQTWRRAPKSPGGDPIRHPWKTQAVVAVSLKHREGTSAWPNCG